MLVSCVIEPKCAKAKLKSSAEMFIFEAQESWAYIRDVQHFYQQTFPMQLFSSTLINECIHFTCTFI